MKTASGLILRYMNWKKFDGITTLFGNIYIRPGKEGDIRLLAHEQMHVQQMKRLGKIVFVIRYFLYSIKYGYQNNPFEIEAREAGKQAMMPPDSI